VAVSIVSRTGKYPVFPSQRTAIAIFLFLTGTTLSLFVTTNPVSGLLDYLQYLVIFLIVVPFAGVILKDCQYRWLSIIGLWLVLSTLLIISIVIGLFNGFRHLALWYGNQNQLYWLIATGTILNAGFAASKGCSLWFRVLCAGLTVLSLPALGSGMTLSAFVMLGVAGWVAGFLLIYHSEIAPKYVNIYLLISVISLAIVSVVIALYWETFYVETSLDHRIPQYAAAYAEGLRHVPLGSGLASSRDVLTMLPAGITRSVHNVLLAYFLEIGVLGVLGFILLVSDWIRAVFVNVLRDPTLVQPFETALALAMAGYFVVLLFQPVPVRRFWWLLFALSWAAIIDNRTTFG
jgi:hypothetical protein